MSHLTIEAKTCIEKADKVLYLVNEPIMEEWIKTANHNTESLASHYEKNLLRHNNYLLIADYIIDNLKKNKQLCVVMYGHPTVFVQPSLYAAKIASELGYFVTILPGISTESCLFADLQFDPSSSGCQSFEATDFLLYRREYDVTSHLVIWQPFVIGLLNLSMNHCPKRGLEILAGYLSEKYNLNHEIVLYEAAQYPSFKPRIDRVKLKELSLAAVSHLTTLYIKPSQSKKPDPFLLNKLKSINL